MVMDSTCEKESNGAKIIVMSRFRSSDLPKATLDDVDNGGMEIQYSLSLMAGNGPCTNRSPCPFFLAANLARW